MRARILLVEDDERLAESLCGYLAKFLYSVTAVSTVHAACEEIAQEHFDIIVQDWILPDGDGRIVLDFAKTNSPETARVVYSAHSTSDAECTASGAHQFVEKGLDIGRLRNAILRCEELNQCRLRVDDAAQTPLGDFLAWVGEQAAVASGLSEATSVGVFGLRGGGALSRCVAKWVGRRDQPQIRFHEINSMGSNSKRIDFGNAVFGGCILRGRDSVVSRGAIGEHDPMHLHVTYAPRLDVEELRRCVETTRTKTFRREGARRDSKFSGLLSLHDAESSPVDSIFSILMKELDVPFVTLPATPLDVCDADKWIQRLSSLNSSPGALASVLPRSGVLKSWRRLLHCANAVFQVAEGSSDALTSVPLFEQAFDDENGRISEWKQIADLPRFVYASWLLNRTGGNIAEASRISRLSRPAIYGAIAGTDGGS